MFETKKGEKDVWEKERMQEDWDNSIIVPIYKQRGDHLECGNNTGNY